MKRYRKLIAATVGIASVVAANLLTPSTAETVNNVITLLLGALTAAGVYQVPNAPASRHTLR